MSGISSHQCGRFKGQRGVTAVIVALLMVVLIGFGALAVDMGHLYLVRNELQKASNAGALAEAQAIYTEDGTAVNEGTNETSSRRLLPSTPTRLPWMITGEGHRQRSTLFHIPNFLFA